MNYDTPEGMEPRCKQCRGSLAKPHICDGIFMTKETFARHIAAAEKRTVERVREKVQTMISEEKAAPPANDLEKTAEWYKISALQEVNEVLNNLTAKEV